jgi:hypothetical protein
MMRRRFLGGHKKDQYITGTLAQFVEWVPVCPEVEIGLGTLRESLRLVGDPNAPHLVTTKTKIDHENFIVRVFCQYRWQTQVTGKRPFRLNDLVTFHAQHKFLLMAHSEKLMRELGKLVAAAKSYKPKE